MGSMQAVEAFLNDMKEGVDVADLYTGWEMGEEGEDEEEESAGRQP